MGMDFFVLHPSPLNETYFAGIMMLYRLRQMVGPYLLSR